MEYHLSFISVGDREPVIDLLNHYIESSFAAYLEEKLPYEAFDTVLKMSKGYPNGCVKDEGDKVVGFGLLRAHHPMATFDRTAEVTYFIHPDHTRRGLGRRLLAWLEEGARPKGIKSILASISSLNPGSIAFHQKNGFVECGRFRKVGMKHGREFDTVWMQKTI